MQPDELVRIAPHFADTYPEAERLTSAAFAPDGETIYVHLHDSAVDLWSLLLWYWPEVGGAVCTLALLVGIAALIRIRSHPERIGAWLCRRCRFEVPVESCDANGRPTPRPGLRKGAVCTECGIELGLKRIRRARSFPRRLACPAAVVLVPVAAYAAAWAWSLPRTGTALDWFLWPSESLTAFAEDRSLAWVLKHKAGFDRILEIDTASGETIRRIGRYRGQTYSQIDIAPSGRSLGRLVGTRPGDIRFQSIDARSGRIAASVPLPLESVPMHVRRWSGIVAWPDGERAVLIAGRSQGRSVVLRCDLDTGSTVELFGARSLASRGNWIAVTEQRSEPTEIVTMSDFSEKHKIEEAIIRVWQLGDGWQLAAEHRVRAGPTDGIPSIDTTAVHVLLPGTRMLLAAAGDVRKAITGVHLDDGRVTVAHGPRRSGDRGLAISMWGMIALSRDGHWLGMSGVTKPSVFVRDTDARRWVAELTFERRLIAPRPMFSADGRYALSIGFFGSPGARPPGPHTNELVLHDLSSLIAATGSRGPVSQDPGGPEG